MPITLKVYLSITLFFFLIASHAQVREVKNRAQDHKEFGEIITDLLLEIMWRGQDRQLNLAERDAWRTSLESSLVGGYDFDQPSTLINPVIRGNWGLYSKQLRWTKISDQTEGFSTLDWQVLHLNLIN